MTLPLLIVLARAIWTTTVAYRRGRAIKALLAGANTAYAHNVAVIGGLKRQITSLEEQLSNAIKEVARPRLTKEQAWMKFHLAYPNIPKDLWEEEDWAYGHE